MAGIGGCGTFESRGAAVLPALLDSKMADFLCSYVRLQVHNGQFDPGRQVVGSAEKYGDPAFEALLGTLLDQVAETVGRPLSPTYSFVRVYRRGQDLVRHTDRPACEYSLTLHLGSSERVRWPVVFADSSGAPHEVDQLPGDAVLYKGCDVDHWRGRCPVDWYVQVFLHYVAADGPRSAERFDRRPYLGLPYSR